MNSMTSKKSLFNMDGKTALITGGSRGLGLQMAEALGAEGARIMLCARKLDELREAQAHLQTLGIAADRAVADISREEDVGRLVQETMQRLGHIDILINNAGTTWSAPAEDHPLDAWDKVFNLNIRGLFLLTQQIGKLSMIPRRYGRIVNVASVAGLMGNPVEIQQTLAYNTSKGAVVNFTRALAAEWGRFGITVNAIAPGYIPSKMTRGLLGAVGADRVAAYAPLNRIGDDEDLKGAALLFASDAGKHITGQILAIDGGACII